MASTFSPQLRIELIGAGEQAGAWNNTTNTNLGTLIEQAISGVAAVTVSSASYTLTTANGATDEARSMVLNVTGTPGAAFNVICPTSSKVYIAKNGTTGGFAMTLKTSTGTGITIPNGRTMLLYCDGTNVVNGVDELPTGSTVNGAVIATLTGAETLTNKTLTSPKIGTAILDTGGNSLFNLTATGSAVNYMTVANAATAGSPSITAAGSDTNVDLLLAAKGSGVVKSGGVEVVTTTGTQTLSNKTISGLTVASPINISATTGNASIVAATGPDANININLTPKGTGVVNTTTVATFAAGTVTEPSIAATGDLNTGVFFPAANTIAFTTDGTEDFRLGPLGQFGIGGANYGTAGQVITSGGSGAAASWSTVSGTTSLGTANTTSGTSATVSGLTLTDYKFLIISLNGVSCNTNSRKFNVSSSTTAGTGAEITGNLDNGDTAFVQAFLNLANGTASGNSLGGLSGITNASTSVNLVLSGSGSFDAGSFTVFGVR